MRLKISYVRGASVWATGVLRDEEFRALGTRLLSEELIFTVLLLEELSEGTQCGSCELGIGEVQRIDFR